MFLPVKKKSYKIRPLQSTLTCKEQWILDRIYLPTQTPSSSFFGSLLKGRKGRGLGWNEGGGTAPVGASPTDREWPARDADVPRRHWTEGQLKGWPFALSAESMRQ